MSIPIPAPTLINTIVITSIVAVPHNEWNGVAWVQDDDKTMYTINYNTTANGIIQGRGVLHIEAVDIPATKPDYDALQTIVEAEVAAQF